MNKKNLHRPLGYTTLAESKKLVEIGINPNTADFVYERIDESTYSISLLTVDFNELCDAFKNTVFIPCWSLGALLELMPKKIDTCDLILNIGEGVFKYENRRYEILVSKHYAIDLILWLTDNNLLKQG